MAGFLPSSDAGLLAWSLQFKTLIVASPTEFGLTIEQATAYDGRHQAYATALAAADPAVRNKPATAAKNDARAALKAEARMLAGLIEHTAGVTDAQKLELGLTVRKDPTPIPVPDTSPEIDIVERVGTIVRIRLHDGTGSRRGRPEGVAGASVFSYVGDQPPVEVENWKFEGNTTRTVVPIEFAPTLPAGTKVWLCGFWYNPRGQSGLGCSPVSAILAGGAMQQAA